jgi:ribosomal-protein-alanine N-acetyltransferase
MIEPAQLTIDAMTLDDVPAVMAIDAVSFPRPWPEQSWRYEIRDNHNARCFVARMAVTAPPLTLVQRLLGEKHPGAVSTVVGMACMWIVIDQAHIATIASAVAYRSQGVGRAVLRRCIDVAHAAGCHNVMLEVRISNHVAQALYRSFGFEVTGERKRYYSDNQEDALVMEILELQSPGYANRYLRD